MARLHTTGNTAATRGRRTYQHEQRIIEEQKVKVSKGPEKIRGIGKIKKKEVCPFTMKMSAMLDAGLPVLQCVEALEEQTDNVEFKKVCRGIYQRVEGGDAFAVALEPYENIFGDLYVKMINAGEQSGNLPDVCAKLAHYMEKSAAIRNKVKSAMMYPTVVICIAACMTAGLITFVVPIFADMFSSLGGDLPGPTKALIALSNIFQDYWYLVIGGIAGLIYGFKWFGNTPGGRMTLDRTYLNLPMFGSIVMKVVIGRMSRTFASLLQSGMPILQTVKIVSETSGNKFIEEAISEAYTDIENGKTITDAFERTKRFPSMLIHMIRAGEKTASMEKMLEKVADFYEDEVDNALEGLSSMLEPILMVGIGSVVGGIVICMFMPIFKIGQAVTG